MRPGRFLALLGLIGCGGPGPAAAPPVEPDPTPLILIGIDGFRPDYLRIPAARTLRAVAEHGVRADLVPAFPTKTFPNLYTIATGLWPEHHGIVGNTIADPAIGRFTIADTVGNRDPRWWKGEPIWITAERQGRRAATMFWPGSEVRFAGRRASDWRSFDARVSSEARVDQVLDWLARPAATRPTFVTLYFNRVDLVGHREGPDGPNLPAAIAEVDSALGRLTAGLQALGTRANLLIVSDHGMTAIDPERVVFLDDWIALDPPEIVDLAPVTTLDPGPGRIDSVVRALGRAPHLRVFRREATPPEWHFRAGPRVSPVVVVADEGWSIATHGWWETHPHSDRGNHGYEPTSPSMTAIVIGVGPAFPTGATARPIAPVHLYPLMARLLGIRAAPNDGSIDSARTLLAPN